MHACPNLFLYCDVWSCFFIIFVAYKPLLMFHNVWEKIKIVLKWIRNHKYIFVTSVFLAIILVLDDNNVIGHIRNRTTINELTNEIKVMEADSVNTQNKLDLYTVGDLGVMEDEARKRGALKKNEEAFIIKKQ